MILNLGFQTICLEVVHKNLWSFSRIALHFYVNSCSGSFIDVPIQEGHPILWKRLIAMKLFLLDELPLDLCSTTLCDLFSSNRS